MSLRRIVALPEPVSYQSQQVHAHRRRGDKPARGARELLITIDRLVRG